MKTLIAQYCSKVGLLKTLFKSKRKMRGTSGPFGPPCKSAPGFIDV